MPPAPYLPVHLKHALGIFLTLLVCSLWTVATFITQYLVTSGKSATHRPVSPFYFTFISTTLFLVFVPFLVLKSLVQRQWNHYRAVPSTEDELRPISTETSTLFSLKHIDRRSLIAAIWITPLWFLGNWMYNISLAYTSATSNTILAQTSSLFTFGFSVWLLSEKYNNRKLLCVFLALAGVIMVTVKDGESEDDGSMHTVGGDFLAIFAAMIYSVFIVVMRMKVGDEHEANLMLVFSLVGFFTTVVCVPIIGLLLLTGIYQKQDVFIPKVDFMLIASEGVIDNVLADILQAQSVLLIGPTLATTGLSFTIPLTAYWEVFQSKPMPAWARKPGPVLLTVVGTLLIMAGFGSLTKLEEDEVVEEAESREREVADVEEVPLVKGGLDVSVEDVGQEFGVGERGEEGGRGVRIALPGGSE